MTEAVHNPRSYPSQAVIFLHMSRTGGTTLQDGISRQIYPDKLVFTTFTFGNSVKDAIEKFIALSPEARSRFPFFAGHMTFGLHRYLHNPYTYISLIRDPTEVVISIYYSASTDPTHPNHKRMLDQYPTFEDLVESVSDYNQQTKAIFGNDGKPLVESPPDNYLEVAKENIINHFSVMGITERFHDSMKLMKKVLGWPDVPYKNLRVNSHNRPKKEELAPAVLDRIAEITKIDAKLYEFARNRFDIQFARYFDSPVPEKLEQDSSAQSALTDQAMVQFDSGDPIAALGLIRKADLLGVPVRNQSFTRALSLYQLDKQIEARDALYEELQYYPGNAAAKELLDG